MRERDTYDLFCSKEKVYYDLNMLFSLYLPLVGSDALALYTLLLEQKYCKEELHTVRELVTLTNFSEAKIKLLRVKLEEYMLLKTYKNDTNYMFVLEPPLSRLEFLQHPVFGRLYQIRVGRDHYLKMSTIQYLPDLTNYENVSSTLQINVMKEWGKEEESHFKEACPNTIDKVEVAISFDYETFNTISQLSFPNNLRTKENMELIGKVATMYHVDAKRMQKVVARSIDMENNVLDKAKLMDRAKKAMNIASDIPNDIYALSPFQFLVYKQNGIPLSDADDKLLRDLLMKFQLEPVVVNVLIEYALQQTNNRLTKSYVEKVATSWARANIDTKEKALEQTAPVNFYASKTKQAAAKMPEWYYESETIEPLTAEDEDMISRAMQYVKKKEDSK